MSNRDHPNAVAARPPIVIETLAGGAEVVGHTIDGGASSVVVVYVDLDGSIGVNLLGAAVRRADVLGQLLQTLDEIGAPPHPAPRVLVDKILAEADRAVGGR